MMEEGEFIKWFAGFVSSVLLIMIATSYKEKVGERRRREEAAEAKLAEHGVAIMDMVNKQEMFQHYIDEQRQMREEFKTVRDSIVKLTTMMGREYD